MMEDGYKIDGRYEIRKPIGEGGMANVYLARDLILDRDVAIKILRLDLQNDPDTIRRFQREELASTELVHPNIVEVYDVGEDSGMQYIVMEYIKGTDLKRYIARNFPIAYPQVIKMMLAILAAVGEAHAHGIIHRDLKPQNILVDETGQVKITDFGIAVALSENSITQTNSMLGSVHYLSPEQARGSIATKRSDIYSLGIILYEMLTSKVPFEGETAVSIALKHFQNQIPSVREFDHNIPQSLENVVLKATAKVPVERYADVSEMAADLKTSLNADRATEAKFKPEIDQEETKVITPISQLDDRLPKDDDAKTYTPKHQTEEKKPVDNSATKAALQQQKQKRRTPLLLVLLAVVILVLLGGGVYAYQEMMSTQVPNVVGLTQTQARKKLAAKNLQLGKTTRQTDQKITNGKVIRSTPKGQVKRNSRVNLVISQGKAKVRVVDYTGQSYSAAAKELRKKGFRVKQTVTASTATAKGVVMTQNVTAGNHVVPEKTTVRLTVSAGQGAFGLSNLINWSQASAQEYASSMGLDLTLKTAFSDSVRSGAVMVQKPVAGKYAQPGDQLIVTISRGQKPANDISFTEKVTVPYDKSTGSSNQVVIYIGDDAHDIGTVYQQSVMTKTTTFKLPFTLKPEASGQYRIVRDGTTINENNNVTK
nr:Stk1 family PASTA domain-containing Ser/Thr kinase [Loigolactobacillus iwatensis]